MERLSQFFFAQKASIDALSLNPTVKGNHNPGSELTVVICKIGAQQQQRQNKGISEETDLADVIVGRFYLGNDIFSASFSFRSTSSQVCLAMDLDSWKLISLIPIGTLS
jgi:hypothetical protein